MESPVPFFSEGGSQGASAPLIALSREAKKGFAEGSAAFLFAFPPEAAQVSGAALEVAVEITSTNESGGAASPADIYLAFLTEDDFERLPREGKPKLKNAVRELQKHYNGRKSESDNPPAVALSSPFAALSECSSRIFIRIAAPSSAPAAGFALFVSAPDNTSTAVISSERKQISCGWLSGEDGRIDWAGFPFSGGALSCQFDPSSPPPVSVPQSHSISVLFKAQPAESLPASGGAASLAAGQKRAVFRSAALNKEFGMRVPPSGGLSVFQPCLLGDEPVEIVSVSGGENIKGIFTSPAFPGNSGNENRESEFLVFTELEPIAADPHGIVEWPQSAWRRPVREIFKWDRFPSVIVFDTADYDVQNRYFRRLAFFAEKQGYRGRLLTDSELAGMHAFNAHDYSAETLASFFSEAALSGFELSDEELELRGILLNSGIILSSSDGAFLPGEGAVISFSRSSPLYLRYSFMAHEGFHALYFVDEGFREKVRDVYASTDQRATAFLRDYFRIVTGLGYDTSDSLLMENEFMGYILQNRIDSVRDYFAVNIAERYLRYNGDEALATYILETNARDFVAAAEELSAYAFSRWGILGGRVGLQFWDD